MREFTMGATGCFALEKRLGGFLYTVAMNYFYSKSVDEVVFASFSSHFFLLFFSLHSPGLLVDISGAVDSLDIANSFRSCNVLHDVAPTTFSMSRSADPELKCLSVWLVATDGHNRPRHFTDFYIFFFHYRRRHLLFLRTRKQYKYGANVNVTYF